MTQLIPGILAKNSAELTQQIRALAFAKKIHVDIMDGKFVHHKTITAQTLSKHFPLAKIQIHYMGKHPEHALESFAKMPIADFIFHLETTKKPAELLEKIRSLHIHGGIAFSPKTPVSQHADSLIHADLALVMSVNCGQSGQHLIKKTLSKIAQIKKYNPSISVGADGGVNLKTYKHVKHADFAIATSAVTFAKKPLLSFKKLQKYLDSSLHSTA